MPINNIHAQIPVGRTPSGHPQTSIYSQQDASPSQEAVTSLAHEGRSSIPPHGLSQRDSTNRAGNGTWYQNLQDLISNRAPEWFRFGRSAESSEAPMLTGADNSSDCVYFDARSQFSESFRTASSRSILESLSDRGSISHRDESRSGSGGESSGSFLRGNGLTPGGTTSPLGAASRPQPGPQGYFYFRSTEGQVHRYDPTVGEILPTGLSGVDHLTLGADHHTYARMGGTVVRLDVDGSIADRWHAIFDPSTPIRDLAVSRLGTEVLLLNESGELSRRSLIRGSTQTTSIALPNPAGQPIGIAASADGAVWLLEGGGNVWRGITTPSEVEWRRVAAPSQPIVALDTLPDGRVAARDAQGKHYRPGKEAFHTEGPLNWKLVPFESLSRMGFQAFHEALNRPGGLEAATNVGGVITSRPLDWQVLTEPFRRAGHAILGLPQMYRDLKDFDYSGRQSIDNAADAFASLQSVFGQRNDLVARTAQQYASTVGMDAQKVASLRDYTELFQSMVDSMKPGDSITLGKSRNNGVNTEVLRLLLTGTLGKLSGWAMPIVELGKLKDIDLSITKTGDGVNFKIRHSNGQYGTMGVKANAGIADYSKDKNTTGTLQAYGGIEVSLKGKYSSKAEDSLSFSVKDRGDGNIGRLVEDVFSGRTNLFELMTQADKTDSGKKQESGWSGSLSGTVMGKTGGYIETAEKKEGVKSPAFNKAGEAWSRVKARDEVSGLGHLVDGLATGLGAFKWSNKTTVGMSLDFAGKSSRSQTVNHSGEVFGEQSSQDFGLKGVKVNAGSVNILESELWSKTLPVDIKKGTGEEYLSQVGRLYAPAVLPGATVSRAFENMAPMSSAVTLTYATDGQPKDIKAKLTFENSGQVFARLTQHGLLSEQTPGLKPLMNTLTHQRKQNENLSAGPVKVGLKLKPVLTENLPENHEERKKRLRMMAADISNFRVSDMSISYSHEAKRTVSLSAPILTREISGSLKTSSDSAKVTFLYSKADVLKQGSILLKSLSHFGDGAWGTTARQHRLTGLMQQLESLVGALAQPPSTSHGDEGAVRELTQAKSEFLGDMRQLLFGTVNPEELSRALVKLEQFSAKVDAIREKYHLPDFEGPAIATSGAVFVKANAGQLHEDFRIGRHDAISLEPLRTSLAHIARLNLSSLSGPALNNARLEVVQQMDVIKRTLNAMTDLNPSAKEAFIVELNGFAVKPGYESGRRLLNMMDSLHVPPPR